MNTACFAAGLDREMGAKCLVPFVGGLDVLPRHRALPVISFRFFMIKPDMSHPDYFLKVLRILAFTDPFGEGDDSYCHNTEKRQE